MNNSSKFYNMLGFLSLLLIITFSSTDCSRQNKTLAEVGDEKVTLGEYEKQYLKTLNNIDSAKAKSMDDRRQFLNLYINFRLKVKDARERRLLNNADVAKVLDMPLCMAGTDIRWRRNIGGTPMPRQAGIQGDTRAAILAAGATT